jgi:predicted alpha/beta hydrolase family esterase
VIVIVLVAHRLAVVVLPRLVAALATTRLVRMTAAIVIATPTVSVATETAPEAPTIGMSLRTKQPSGPCS